MATHRALRIKLALHEDKAAPEMAVAELPGQPYGAAPTLLLPAGMSVLQPCESSLPSSCSAAHTQMSLGTFVFGLKLFTPLSLKSCKEFTVKILNYIK